MPHVQQDLIRQTARRLALDHYISALLAPRAVRNDLITLAAFKGEIDSIALNVTEPLIGELRLQWWRDAFQSRDHDTSTANPLADALLKVVDKYDLERQLFDEILDAQTPFVYGEPDSSLTEFMKRLAAIDGTAFKLSAQISNPHHGDDINLIDAATKSAGQAYGTARVLSQLRNFAKRGTWPLPMPAGTSMGVTGLDFVADKHRAFERRLSVIQAIEAARRAKDAALSLINKLSNPVKSALLLLALVEPYFKAFESARGDPLLMNIDVAPLLRRYTLLRARTATFG